MRKDLPCADCGEPMWRGPDSLPEGVATCLPCRRRRPGYGPRKVVRGTLTDRDCLGCDATYSPHRQDQRYCSTACNSRCKARAGGKRTCELCAESYKPTYVGQRTCGRICGAQINAHVRRAIDAPAMSSVKWRQCRRCSIWYTTVGKKRCTCSIYKPTSGVRSIQCKDCAKPFGYVIVSNHPARCPECREVEAKRRKKDARKARRALQRGAQVEPVNVAKVYERDRWRCGLCGKRVNKRLQYPHPMSASLDHVVPLSLDGAHSMANVQLAHLSCNHEKSNGGWQQLALIG